MKILHNLIKVLSILPMVISGFASMWLFWQYQKPQVIYYTDGYYSRINDLLIGSIFIVNEGRSSETNLSVLISEKLLISDIAIDYLSTKPEFVNEANKTRITIQKLKPHEYAEIVFRSRMATETFEIESIASDSGNIRHEEWVKKSWRSFTKLQLGIILLVVTVVFGLGFWIGSIKNNLFAKKARPSRATRK